MKSITSILAVLALGTTVAFAAPDKKPDSTKAPGAAGSDATKATGAKTDAAAVKGDKPKADPAAMFKKLDANSDGKVSAEEWKASPQSKKDATKAEEMFSKKDKDGDKNLSMDEFSAGGKKKDK